MRSEWRVTNGESTKLRDTSAAELAKKTGRGGGGSSQNYENPINPWHRNKDFWWLMQHLKYLHFMVFFTLLVWARESSQKKTHVFELGEVSFSLTPRSQTWKSLFVPCRFLKKKKNVEKEIQITTKSYKTNGSFGSELTIFKSAYEVYTAVSRQPQHTSAKRHPSVKRLISSTKTSMRP